MVAGWIHLRRLCETCSVVILSILGITCSSGCGPVIKLVYGVHQPNFKPDKAVISYAGRMDWHDAIYRLREFHADNRTRFRYVGNSLPGVMLFNSAGQLTSLDVDCSGNLNHIVEW